MYFSRERSFFVYIMSNRSKTLYTGVTNNLLRRVWEHKQAVGSEFFANTTNSTGWFISNASSM